MAWKRQSYFYKRRPRFKKRYTRKYKPYKRYKRKYRNTYKPRWARRTSRTYGRKWKFKKKYAWKDFDRDGKVKRYDCEPLNRYKQDNIFSKILRHNIEKKLPKSSFLGKRLEVKIEVERVKKGIFGEKDKISKEKIPQKFPEIPQNSPQGEKANLLYQERE